VSVDCLNGFRMRLLRCPKHQMSQMDPRDALPHLHRAACTQTKKPGAINWPRSSVERRPKQVLSTLDRLAYVLKVYVCGFYRRDAMLACVLAIARVCSPVCLWVCLSQVGVLSEWIYGSSWVLALRHPSTYPTLCYKETRNFTANSGFREIRHGTLMIATCC